MTGYQYYWLVASGLVLSLLLSVPIPLLISESEPSSPVALAFLALIVFPGICYLTVWWEIFSTYRGKALFLALALLLAAFFTNGVSVILLGSAPYIYWLLRINGAPFANNT